jgi:hypothetical protein
VAKVKKKVSIGVIIVAMVILIAVSGSVMAARPVPAGNEFSVINVQTSSHGYGIFLAPTELVLQQSNGDLNPPIERGDQISTVVNIENTIAINGETDYSKNTNINTGNVVNGQENAQTGRIITFDGGDGGTMVSGENVLVQTIASQDTSSTICPWESTTNTTLPAECETVQAGSKMDVFEVSASSSSGVRVIADTPGTTVSLDYSIDAHGINQTPGRLENAAIGSATAYVDGNILENAVIDNATAYVDGNILESIGNGTAPSCNVEYHDVTSVNGLFDLSKTVSYDSSPS